MSWITKVFLAAGTLALVFVVVLGLHIYKATHKADQNIPVRLMGRIDFEEKPDSVSALRIRGMVKSFEGVQTTYFNIEDGILVFVYDGRKQTGINIFTKLQAQVPFKVSRYEVPEELATKGCPAMAEDQGWKGKLVQLISSL